MLVKTETKFGVKYYNKSNLYYHLKQIDWGIIGFLTWDDFAMQIDNPKYESKRNYDFWAWLSQGLSRHGMRLKKLGVFKRTEFGASNQSHYHFLIARTGLRDVSALCEDLVRSWEKKGVAVIHEYNTALPKDGIGYQCKIEYDAFGKERNHQERITPVLERLIKQKGGPAPASLDLDG